MHNHYKLPGTDNICERELDGLEYNDPDYWPTFQEEYNHLQKQIIESHGKPQLFLRAFDGEFHFLQGNYIGNIPKRHISETSSIDTEQFRQGFLKADYHFTQIYKDFLPSFKSLFPGIRARPMEHLYALVANRWIFRQGFEIGIIGGESKINAIKKLLTFGEYRNYLFGDCKEKEIKLVSVPERFCCNDPDKILSGIQEQIEKLQTKPCMWLIGIGISKLAIAWKLRDYTGATVIDIGCGITAMAGSTSLERPYFGGWTNYRLPLHSIDDPIDYIDTRGRSEIVVCKSMVILLVGTLVINESGKMFKKKLLASNETRLKQYTDGIIKLCSLVDSETTKIFIDNSGYLKQYSEFKQLLLNNSITIVANAPNEYGGINKGAGVIESLEFSQNYLKNYDRILYFEPRQLLIDTSFIDTVKNEMIIDNFFCKDFVENQYHTGMFCMGTRELQQFIYETPASVLCKYNQNIESAIYLFIDRHKHKIEKTIVSKLKLLWHDSKINRHLEL